MFTLEDAQVPFGSDYSEAKQKFLDACRDQKMEVEEYLHPLLGITGEKLASHAVRIGRADAENLVIIVSGTHGLEALAGSGFQTAYVRQYPHLNIPGGTAILLVHMINPWGCSWRRRQNEDNVDLNRSFIDRAGPLPANPVYDELHPIVVGTSSEIPAGEDPAVRAFFGGRDEWAAVGAIMTGQHAYPDGIGYCGSKPSWAERTLSAILSRYADKAQRVAIIDIHTGVGPYGHGSLYSLAPSGSAELARARAWYGQSLDSLKDGEAAYPTQGELVNWISAQVPGEATGVVIEYGTFDLSQFIKLEIDDARIWREGRQNSEQAGVLRQKLQHHFVPATDDWYQSIVFRAFQITEMAIRGLNGDGNGIAD